MKKYVFDRDINNSSHYLVSEVKTNIANNNIKEKYPLNKQYNYLDINFTYQMLNCTLVIIFALYIEGIGCYITNI